MIFLLDTNVLSEAAKPRPAAKVIAWLRRVPVQDLRVSAMVVAEIKQGVELNPTTPLREFLATTLREFLIAPFGEEEALAWGKITAAAVAAGHSPDFRDSIIAATAEAQHWTVATRNRGDFQLLGVACFSPWED